MLWLLETDRLAYRRGARRSWPHFGCGVVFMAAGLVAWSLLPEGERLDAMGRRIAEIIFYAGSVAAVIGWALLMWGAVMQWGDSTRGWHVDAAERYRRAQF